MRYQRINRITRHGWDNTWRLFRRSANRATAEAQPGSAAYEVPRAYRGWLRDFLQELAAAAGAPDPGLLASQIHLLYDGAMLAASLDGNAGITEASRAGAEALLDAALASRASGRHRRQHEFVQAGTFDL